MVEQKRSECASESTRRPSPERNDDSQPGASNPPAQGPHNSLESQLAFLREMKEHFKDVDPGKYEAFLNLLDAQKRGRVGPPCVISQVKELFRGHTEMLRRFNEILRPELKILVKEDVPEIQDLATLYVAKVKARTSPSEYTTFMHILYLYNERALTVDEIDQEVEVLFAKSCDLLEEFDCFRPDRPAPVVQSPLHPRHSTLEVSELQREQQSERLQRMCEQVAKQKEKGKGAVTESAQQQPPPSPPKGLSLRLANAANTLGHSHSSVQAHPRRPNRSPIVSATPPTETQGRSRKRGLEDAEFNGRSMCTPSYLMRKTPNNDGSEGEGEVSVHRSELAKSVLNEECALVVPEGNFKERIINPYEEVLFTCEMDQYECDMIIKRLEATIGSLADYYSKLQEPNNGELPPIEEVLLAVHKRCIQQLYNDDDNNDAQTFITALKQNPAQALPILLNWFMSKLAELESIKETITPKWAQVYKNNFHLSLNYQSKNCKSKQKLKNINNLEASTSGSTNPTSSS